jgi:uncharacterized membrane protein YqaE (UPF0057 family)
MNSNMTGLILKIRQGISWKHKCSSLLEKLTACSIHQEISHLLQNWKVHYHVHNSLPLVPIFSLIFESKLPTHFPKTHFNIITQQYDLCCEMFQCQLQCTTVSHPSQYSDTCIASIWHWNISLEISTYTLQSALWHCTMIHVSGPYWWSLLAHVTRISLTADRYQLHTEESGMLTFQCVLWWTRHFALRENVSLQNSHLYVFCPVCTRICETSIERREKVLLHTSHLNGFSPVWVRKCSARWHFWVNVLLHISHLKGLSPVWHRLCVSKWERSTKSLLHTSHLYGLSPVWIRLCLRSWGWQRNPLLHTWQKYGFTEVWVRLCFLRQDFRVNVLLHISHLYGLSSEWIRLCVARLYRSMKDLLHISHTNGFSPVCVLLCFNRWALSKKPLLHTSQVYCLSPIWIRKCFFRRDFWWKALLQISHLYVLCLSCACTCSTGPSFSKYFCTLFTL